MRKNTGKVLSMILAMAMVVSSFSATFVSASTQEVVGNDARVNTGKTSATDDYDVVSDKYDDLILIEDLDNAYEVQTLDREDLDDVEYVSFSKVSGDSLVKVVKDEDDSDKRNLMLKKNASGTETIRINYKGTYTDDETDREVTARGSIEVDITANVEGTVVLAPVGTYGGSEGSPDDVELAAVNDSGFQLALYMASHDSDRYASEDNSKWDIVEAYRDDDVEDDDYTDGYFDISSDKNFVTDNDADYDDKSDWAATDGSTTSYVGNIFNFVLKHDDEEGGNYYAKTFSTKLEVYSPKVEVDEADGPSVVYEDTDKTIVKKGERIRADIGVGKKWKVEKDGHAEISKLGARTLLALDNATTDFEDEKYSDIEKDAKIVTGFEIVMDSGTVAVNGGSIDSIDGAYNVTIENATVNGDVVANAGEGSEVTVGEGAKVNGTVKDALTIDLQDGASVNAIDESGAAVTMDGASVSGDVTAKSLTANDNDEYNNSIGGDVEIEEASIEATDGSFNIGGALIAATDTAEFNFEGDNISIGSIDADYFNPTLNFDDATITLAITNMNGFNTILSLTNESDVTINGSARLGSIEVEEDSKIGRAHV